MVTFLGGGGKQNSIKGSGSFIWEEFPNILGAESLPNISQVESVGSICDFWMAHGPRLVRRGQPPQELCLATGPAGTSSKQEPWPGGADMDGEKKGVLTCSNMP